MSELKRGRKKNVFIPSVEQSYFVEQALLGKNILVDACIGSGKTSSIQYLCGQMPDKKILYLTYNKLLKLDAKKKIKNSNVTVTNYHGFATWILRMNKMIPGYADSIQQLINAKPTLHPYDVLIIDEYQDIEQELAELLLYIRSANPSMQLIAVGDMEQKIYDKTTLNVPAFINEFLGEYKRIDFTQCFRLPKEHAEMLGRIWNKNIVGVNDTGKVETMDIDDVTDFLASCEPKDILCLGSRTGDMTKILNKLEERYPAKFNKKTVFASIRSTNEGGSTEPGAKSAIFTTFDSSKGMERPICVVFDWTYEYWFMRLTKPGQSFEILRNIFCVAASRGKDRIIFVDTGYENIIEEAQFIPAPGRSPYASTMTIDGMFDFKYKEDIECAYHLLDIKRTDTGLMDSAPLQMRERDGLIDLLPCISVYQMASFFKNYKIDRTIEKYLSVDKDMKFRYTDKIKKSDVEIKILFYISLLTNHNRYVDQVELPLVEEHEKNKLHARLGNLFTGKEEVQRDTEMVFQKKDGDIAFTAVGLADVFNDNTYYSIEYTSTPGHVAYLKCACYAIANGLTESMLLNIYDNSLYQVSIPDKKGFLDAVAKAVTKGHLTEYYGDL